MNLSSDDQRGKQLNPGEYRAWLDALSRRSAVTRLCRAKRTPREVGCGRFRGEPAKRHVKTGALLVSARKYEDEASFSHIETRLKHFTLFAMRQFCASFVFHVATRRYVRR